MPEHQVEVHYLGGLYYAGCSCGWKAKGRFSEAMAKREGEEHVAEPSLPPSLLSAHRNGQMEWGGTPPVSESGGLLNSAMDRIRNGQGPRFQFGEILGGLARRGSQLGKPSNEPSKPAEVAHQTDDERPPATRYQCFMLGAQLGDTLEDLQEQTEDLVEQIGMASKKLDTTQISPTDSLRNLASDLRDLTIVASDDCQLTDNLTYNLVQDIWHKIIAKELYTADDVMNLRRELDQLTGRMAALENTA